MAYRCCCFLLLTTVSLLISVSTAYVNVIVLTYRRSGSSYVGELLSAQPSASYYFEPLTYSSLVLLRQDQNSYKEILKKSLTCDEQLLGALVKRISGVWVIRKFGNKTDIPKTTSNKLLKSLCLNSSVHVAKTIRLRLETALKLLKEKSIPNLRIVHLVRDPRARFASVNSKAGNWNSEEKSLERMCQEMEGDVRYWETHQNQLPPSVYLRLKYEDVLANPRNTVQDIYQKFFLTAYDQNADKLITEHNSDRIIRNEDYYYSTYRNSSFDPNEWRKKLNQQQITQIEDKCRYVLQRLNYL